MKMTIVLLHKHVIGDRVKLAKVTEHIVNSVISQLQNKSQLTFHQFNA